MLMRRLLASGVVATVLGTALFIGGGAVSADNGSAVTVVACTPTNDGSLVPPDLCPLGQEIATDPEGPDHYGADPQTGATVELNADGQPDDGAETAHIGVDGSAP
jgi:hypothetical protein